MRYIIIGAGAIGGAIGGRLFGSGHDVVLVARGAHYQALRDSGLRLATPDGTRLLSIPVVDRPEALELHDDDVLVFAMKTQDTGAALDAWAGRPVEGGGTAADRLPIVCAQNGVENERLALRWFKHVYGMCLWLPASHLEPGVVAAEGAPLTGILHIGRYPSGTDETARRIGADLDQSVFQAPVVPAVMRWKYAKLLANLGNALEAICGPLAGDDGLELRRRAVAEGSAVLEAAGIEHASVAEQAERRGDLVQATPIDGVARSGGSTWQSLARGTGSIESDYLNGEIVLLGRMHGVPTPVNEVLRRVAKELARKGEAPGSVTTSELMALVDAEERATALVTPQ